MILFAENWSDKNSVTSELKFKNTHYRQSIASLANRGNDQLRNTYITHDQSDEIANAIDILKHLNLIRSNRHKKRRSH